MSTSEDAPLLTASSRRRGGAVLAAVALALAGGLAFAVANAMTQLNSGLHGKVGSIEKWLLIVIVVLGAVCLLCCVCCIIHVGTCGIL